MYSVIVSFNEKVQLVIVIYNVLYCFYADINYTKEIDKSMRAYYQYDKKTFQIVVILSHITLSLEPAL